MTVAATTAGFSYDQFVVVAESECQMEENKFKLSLKLGHKQWKITRRAYSYGVVPTVQIVCKDLAAHGVADDNVRLEVLGYCRAYQVVNNGTGSKYDAIWVQDANARHRHVFTRSSNSLSIQLPGSQYGILLTLRLLKDRASLPDFTLATTTTEVDDEQQATNGKLRVGTQIFHINKQLLSTHSEYFDRMFDGAYKEANQAVVELMHEEAKEPALFHDFLLVMCVSKALPNTKNVADLLKLAHIYQAETVITKCLSHLWKCREMAVEQRLLLASEYGDQELQTSILNNLDLEESKRINTALLSKLFVPYGQSSISNTEQG